MITCTDVLLFSTLTNLAKPTLDAELKFPSDPNNLGGFSVDYYWSSTEGAGTAAAYPIGFSNGHTPSHYKSGVHSVRAVRAF